MNGRVVAVLLEIVSRAAAPTKPSQGVGVCPTTSRCDPVLQERSSPYRGI
jgi:hypothetical protein